MESQLTTAVLCFLGLLVIVQALPNGPEDLAKYVKCATYADCLSDKTNSQKLIECINELKPEEVKSVYQAVVDYYKWKSNNLYDVVTEYCTIDDAEKPDAYTRSFKGIIAHEQKICADGSKKDECTRLKNLMDCHFGYLDQLNQEGKCQIDA